MNDWITDTKYPFGYKGLHSSFFHPRFERVVHVVRSPMRQISAFTSHTNKSYAFAYEHLKFIYKVDLNRNRARAGSNDNENTTSSYNNDGRTVHECHATKSLMLKLRKVSFGDCMSVFVP